MKLQCRNLKKQLAKQASQAANSIATIGTKRFMMYKITVFFYYYLLSHTI